MSLKASPVQILPCVVFQTPISKSDRVETMLALAHRNGRLPVSLFDQHTNFSLTWQCSDGLIEQIAIAPEHPDTKILWKEIRDQGLLVSEYSDADTIESSLSDMTPVVCWILKTQGSSGLIYG